MIGINFPNPINRTNTDSPPDIVATVKANVDACPGFPFYVLHNPDQWGSANEGMGYPYGLDGRDWKEAYALTGSELWARIGGCEPNDLPPTDGAIDTLFKKLRPPTSAGATAGRVALLDFGSGSTAAAPSTRLQRGGNRNGFIVGNEANAKRDWVEPDANTWIVTEWFHLEPGLVPAGAVTNFNAGKHWSVAELLKIPATKVVVEVISESRKGLGFTSGAPGGWAAKKVELAARLHAIDPARVMVSVRATGIDEAGLAKLRALNAGV